MNPHSRTVRLLLPLLAALCAAPAAAQGEPTCETPRQAIDSLLYWQQPEHTNPARAAACLDMPADLPASEAPVRARQIKDILDGRGLYVDLESAPAVADHRDAGGQPRYVPFPKQLPSFYVEQVGERWLWSEATVAAAPALHAETFALDLTGFERRLPEWARGEVMGVPAWKLVALLLLLFLALLVRLAISLLVATQARRVMGRVGARWGAELLARVDRPIGTLAAAGVLALLLPVLVLPVRLTLVFLLATRVVAAFSAVWALYRLVDVFTGWIQQKAEKTETKLDDQLVPLVRTALKVFIVALGVIFVLQNLDIDVGSLLAGLGLGGLAFALAARDTVANLFGAVTIFLDRPFHIGDWVVMAGTEGIIERVGFRSSRVRTFYNSLVYVPNSKVADSVIDNYGARVYRRVKTTVGVTYDTSPEQLQAFVEGIRAIIQANPFTRKDYYEIHFNEFGESSLNVLVYFFVKVGSWSEELRERHNVFLEILRLARELNVDFAFPTRTLHVDSLVESGTASGRETPAALADIVQAFGPDGRRSRPEGPKITHGYYASVEGAGSVRGETSAREETESVD